VARLVGAVADVIHRAVGRIIEEAAISPGQEAAGYMIIQTVRRIVRPAAMTIGREVVAS
jgi:hypothetical protein